MADMQRQFIYLNWLKERYKGMDRPDLFIHRKTGYRRFVIEGKESQRFE